MQLSLIDKKAEKVNLADGIFTEKFNEPLIHQVVTAYMAGGRSGTHAQKTRAEVNGGGKKPWRQKGTGSARSGTTRSPLWRKGGVIFAAKYRDYSQKVNKKMYRLAMRSIWSELIRQERLHILDKIEILEPKTKLLVSFLNQYNLKNTLIILDNDDENVILASRNLPHVVVISVHNVDPLRLIKFENVLTTKAAIQKIEEQLA